MAAPTAVIVTMTRHRRRITPMRRLSEMDCPPPGSIGMGATVPGSIRLSG